MGSSVEQPGQSTHGTDSAAVGRTAPSCSVLWGMIALIAGTPLLAGLVSFPITRSYWYSRYADPQWIRTGNRIYTAHDLPCEVLVYGDSTAMTGVDPAVVQRETGLKTCNIAQTKGVLVTLGTTGLDMFLRHNPKPRFLVLQFSGQDFYTPRSWKDTSSYMEGVVPLLRYYPARDFLHVLALHPEIFMGMMHYAYITGPENWWINKTKFRNWNPDTALVNVHFLRPGPPISDCQHAIDIDPDFHGPEESFVKRMRTRYSGAAGHLLIDVAPVSVCAYWSTYVIHHLQGIDNSLEQFPADQFNEGYTHYTKQGAQRLSTELAAQIQAVLTRSMPSGESRASAGGAN